MFVFSPFCSHTVVTNPLTQKFKHLEIHVVIYESGWDIGIQSLDVNVLN